MKRNSTLRKILPRTSKLPVSTSGQRDASFSVQKKRSSSELVPTCSNDRRGKVLPKNNTSISIGDDQSDLAKYDRTLMMAESTDNYVNIKHESPLSEVYCAGQQLVVRGAEHSTNTKVEERRNADTFAKIDGQKETQSLALNKLYSSLKKLRSRRDSPTVREVQRDVRSRCLAFPFKNCKGFGQNEHSFGNEDIGEEEIFILLGGKSKAVRFEVNPDNLNLVENEFGLKLKSKSITASFDQEDCELLKKFREKYRTGVPRNESPFVPWARHAVFRSRKATVLSNDNVKTRRDVALPCATYEVEEEEFGRKLSIHVYLPNVVSSNN